MDEKSGAFGEAFPIEESTAWPGPPHIGKSRQAQTGVELPLVAGAEPAQRAIDAGSRQVPYPDEA